jgi:hypothetical protein
MKLFKKMVLKPIVFSLFAIMLIPIQMAFANSFPFSSCVGKLTQNGDLFIKKNGQDVLVAGNVKQFSMSTNRIGIVDNSGNAWVKEDSLDNHWGAHGEPIAGHVK